MEVKQNWLMFAKHTFMFNLWVKIDFLFWFSRILGQLSAANFFSIWFESSIDAIIYSNESSEGHKSETKIEPGWKKVVSAIINHKKAIWPVFFSLLSRRNARGELRMRADRK